MSRRGKYQFKRKIMKQTQVMKNRLKKSKEHLMKNKKVKK